jgi:photosystem II stability/assembly factor-like uncharacterized protein
MRTSLLLLIALICVSYNAYCQWDWKRPKPQGYDLLSVDFINPFEGWASGEHGTILHTTDGGSTWTIQSLAITNHINVINFVDSQHGWCCFSTNNFVFILKTVNGGTHWDTCYYEEGISEITELFFINANTGWAVGKSGAILKTTNSGLSWERVNIPEVSNVALNDIYFRDSLNGWFCGEYGKLFKTNNGGITWDSIPTATSKNFYSLCFPTVQNGYVSMEGEVLATKDNGQTWVVQDCGVYSPFMDISFINADTGIGFGQTPARTLDGGITWTLIYLPTIFISAGTSDGSFAWMVGLKGCIYWGINYGETWLELSEGTLDETWYDLDFYGENFCFILEGNKLLKTCDGGDTWSKTPISAEYYETICFTSPNNGWVAGNKQILRTTDAGITWDTVLTDPEDDSFFDVFFIDSLTGWSNQMDKIVKTTDGGNTWESFDYLMYRQSKLYFFN